MKRDEPIASNLLYQKGHHSLDLKDWFLDSILIICKSKINLKVESRTMLLTDVQAQNYSANERYSSWSQI